MNTNEKDGKGRFVHPMPLHVTPVFPSTEPRDAAFHLGMTMRQYYAGQAMIGFLANGEITRALADAHHKKELKTTPPAVYAEKAVAMADALIAELSK